MDSKNSDAAAEHLELSSPSVEASQPLAGEVEYRVSRMTLLALVLMSLSWGTCTLANVGPSSTYSSAVAELGGQPISSWIPNAALFPLIGLQPVWGSFADRYGKKWFIVAGGVVGILGNIVAATAKRTEAVIGGQALNGIGSSLLLLVIPASMEVVPAKQRSFVQGGTGLVNGLMSIVGIITAGAFAQISITGWRWVYYFNAVFFAISGSGTYLFYRPPPPMLMREREAGRSALKDVDFIGMLTLLFGVVGVVLALTWGGNVYPWNSAAVVASLVVGVFFLAVFGAYGSNFGIKNGILDHRFFESRNFPIVASVAFIDGMLLYGVNSFLPIKVSGVFTDNAMTVNLYLLPLNLLVLVGIAVSSYVLGVTKHYRTILIPSVFLLALFCGLLALVTPSRKVLLLVFTALIGFGVGVTTVIPVVVMSYSVPSHLLGTAGTMFASCRALGGTIGITIFTAIYSKAQSGVATGDKASTAKSFQFVWVANAVIGVSAGLLTLFLQPVSHQMTAHVESALESGKVRDGQGA
ncbi:major facilitator superfamily domain-containing protein [Aspergillus carlsbadensis]|nr:major facilitator superfamily domain-containing protein [Aspergillus carlsbadensis]